MMRRRVVFIVGGYYPVLSVTGSCANSIIEEMSQTTDITVIARTTAIGQRDNKDEHSDIRYYNYFDNRIKLYLKHELKSANKVKKVTLKAIRTFVRAYGFIRFWTGRRTINRQATKAIYNQLKLINEEIDVIVPVCLPFESVVAAIKFKKEVQNSVKVAPLLYDLFSENPALHRTQKNKKRRLKKHLIIEREMCEQSDRLLFVEAWEEHLDTYFSEQEAKFCKTEHPLLKRIISKEKVAYNSQKINIVYTGALYKKIRNPLYSLKFFSHLIDKNNKIVLHFYINGDCNETINDFCERYPENIINHGTVSKETAKAAMLSSDILLSIGNMSTAQVPSKIFEYISSGKTILHFSSVTKDPVVDILKQYNNCYCIEGADQIIPHTVAEGMKIIEGDMKQIKFEEVEKLFYTATPQYTANKIIELL